MAKFWVMDEGAKREITTLARKATVTEQPEHMGQLFGVDFKTVPTPQLGGYKFAIVNRDGSGIGITHDHRFYPVVMVGDMINAVEANPSTETDE